MPVLLRRSSARVLRRSCFVVLLLTIAAEGVTDATASESVPEQSEASVSQNFKSLPIYPDSLSTEVVSAGDSSKFAGNPTNTMFNWWPEDLVLAPIPGFSPEFGWSLAIAGGYFLDLDKPNPDTPNSLVGAFGWYAENGSYAGGAGAKFNLLNDRLRLNAAAGYGELNYRFYGIGNDAGDRGISVRIDQQAPVLYGSAKYEVLPDTYLGLALAASRVDTSISLEFELLPPDFPSLNLESNITALGVPLEIDTRDNEQFPRTGWLIKANTFLYRKWLGGDIDTETASLSINRYIPFRARDTLALRFSTRLTGDDAPFYLLSSFGGSTDLRGYESGRYRDKAMYAVQGEYRWQPHDRWIFTGFAGVGEVAKSYSEFFDSLLPAGGVGTRFVLSPKHKLSLSFNAAVGKHGAEFYFGVGEAF